LYRRRRLKEPFAKFIEGELGAGVLLTTCGLPGTWKTETSEEISRIKGYPILRSDLIRLEVLKDENIFDEKVASDMNKRTMVYDETFRRADEALEKGDSVILDATFSGVGWDITAVANPGLRNPSYPWNIVNNVTYPFLSWEP